MSTTAELDDELQLSDYLRILRRRWLWILLVLLLVLAAVAAYASRRAPQYQTTAQVLLADSAAQRAIQGEVSPFLLDRSLANEINLAKSDAVEDEVRSKLGGDLPTIDIGQSDNSDLLSFTATALDPDDAADEANTWANVYIETKRNQAAESIEAATAGLETELGDLREQRQIIRQPLDRLEDRLVEAESEALQALLTNQINREKSDLEVELDLIDTKISTIASNVTSLQLETELARAGTAQLVQKAAAPTRPSNSSSERLLVLGGIVGLILGAGLAILLDNLDRSIKTVEDVTALGVPALGAIPRPRREFGNAEVALATMNHADSPVADGYQKVRTAVEFALIGRKITSLLITSPNQSEGKTTTSCNLAWAMSAVDHRVVLADVDFRRPRIHEVFGCDSEPGLSDNLLHGTPLNHLALRVDGDRSNMVIIPTGASPPSPGDFVASPAFTDLLRNLENEADLVILDSPPVLPVSDALSIARQVDGVIVVCKAGSTSEDQLERSIESLRAVGADILGVCLVGTKLERSRYGYGYGYGQRKTPEKKTRSQKQAVPDLIDVSNDAPRENGNKSTVLETTDSPMAEIDSTST